MIPQQNEENKTPRRFKQENSDLFDDIETPTINFLGDFTL
jgi:hypothetical protein